MEDGVNGFFLLIVRLNVGMELKPGYEIVPTHSPLVMECNVNLIWRFSTSHSMEWLKRKKNLVMQETAQLVRNLLELSILDFLTYFKFFIFF